MWLCEMDDNAWTDQVLGRAKVGVSEGVGSTPRPDECT